MMMTDRDIQILEWVHECRFLTRGQIERLSFPGRSSSRAKLRLALLYHNGYLGRLHIPLRDAHGASRAVYFLDRRGARYLSEARRLDPDELHWRSRDSEREETFLAHTLDINDTRISFGLACRPRGLRLDWTDEGMLRRMNVRERLRGHGGETVLLLPDAYFTISGDGWADGFALEVDRGTVSHRRMRARMRAYGEWASSGAYRRHLPVPSLRVLFAVTDTGRDPRRLDLLKEWCEQEHGGSLFWFVDGDGLRTGDVLADQVWQVAGESGLWQLPLGGD